MPRARGDGSNVSADAIVMPIASRVDDQFPQWDSATGTWVSAPAGAANATQVPFTPNSPTGDITETNTQLAVTGIDTRLKDARARLGVLEAGGLVSHSETTVSITNTTVDTSTGTHTLPANSLSSNGDLAIYTVAGSVVQDNAAVPTLTPRFKIDGADVIAGAAIASSDATNPFDFLCVAEVTRRSATEVLLTARLELSATGATTVWPLTNANKTLFRSRLVTFDCTVAHTLALFKQWSAPFADAAVSAYASSLELRKV